MPTLSSLAPLLTPAALPSLRVYPLFSQLRYPPVLDPRLEEAAAELAAIMKDIAGMRDAAEGDRAAEAAAIAAADGDEAAAEAAAAAADPTMRARIDSLQTRLREIVGTGKGAAAGEEEDGKDGDEEEEEPEEVDSEAGDEDDDDLPVLDSGGEDEEEDEEDDEEEAAAAQRNTAAARSGGRASTSAVALLGEDDEDEDDDMPLGERPGCDRGSAEGGVRHRVTGCGRAGGQRL